MDEQQRAALLGEIATEAGVERTSFLNDAAGQFVAFIDANRERLRELGGLVLIDEDPEYLSVTTEGTFRSRTRYQDDSGEWVSETEEIESGAELVEIYNPADLYAAFADAARDEAGLEPEAIEEAEEAEEADLEAEEADLEPEEEEPERGVDDWMTSVPTPRDKPHAARLLYDLALTFQERSQLDQAQLLDDFQDASAHVAAVLGDSKVLEDEEERLWYRSTGAFEGEVVPEPDESGEEGGESEWKALTTPEDMVQFYDPTDLFGDLAEALAEQYPDVAPELEEGNVANDVAPGHESD